MIGRMPADAPAPRGRSGLSCGDEPAYPARRVVLAAAITGPLALALAACDIRLQDDAPPLPLLERKSIPDEAALVRAVQATAALAQEAGRVSNPTAAVTRLGALHLRQSAVLRSRLTTAGVPNHVIDEPAPTSTGSPTARASGPTPTPAVSAPAAATQQSLATNEAATATAALADLTSVSTANREILVSVAAACGAASEELGTPMTWSGGNPLPAAAAVDLLADTRSAAWAFQVVAAQTSADTRSAALSAYQSLAARAAELSMMAGSAAPEPPLGYALPFPVTSAEAAARLATEVTARLVDTSLGPLALVAQGSSALATLVRLQVAAVSLARGWGVSPGPFPGMTYP